MKDGKNKGKPMSASSSGPLKASPKKNDGKNSAEGKEPKFAKGKMCGKRK